jgi:hypothetical protein
MNESAYSWWRSRNTRFNIILFLVVAVLLPINFFLPQLFSLFEPCAAYVESDPTAFAVGSVLLVGLFNALYLILMFSEKAIPMAAGSVYRVAMFQFALSLFVIVLVWGCLRPYFPAIVLYPDVLCD